MQNLNDLSLCGNNSSLPSQITIHSLPQLYPIRPPNFQEEASKSLNFGFQTARERFCKTSHNYNQTRMPVNRPSLPFQSRTLSIDFSRSLIQENQPLKKDFTQLKKLYEEQKFKYNQLKNLYKQGEAMFQMLQQKKISLQKQNKQLKNILQNLYKQLHQQNENSAQLDLSRQKRISESRVQKIKIGNKKIPIIKVNVPAQTFVRKEHGKSVSSINGQEDFSQLHKQQITFLRAEVNKLTELNNDLAKQLQQQKMQPKESQNAAQNVFRFNQKAQGQFNGLNATSQGLNATFKKQQQSNLPRFGNMYSDIPPKDVVSFTQFSTIQKADFLHANQKSSTYQQNESSTDYFTSKYDIMETQLKKKDQLIKDLYNQCFLLQKQINQIKLQKIEAQPRAISSEAMTCRLMDEQKQIKKQINFQRSKASQLQSKVMQLNSVNLLNQHKISKLKQAQNKMDIESSNYQQKILNQQFQLSRLYKILQNKNNQLGQIYSVMKQSKRTSQLETSKKKSVDNILTASPQRPIFDYQHERKRLFPDNFTAADGFGIKIDTSK